MEMIANVRIAVDTVHDYPEIFEVIKDVEKAIYSLLANKDGFTYIISSIEQKA